MALKTILSVPMIQAAARKKYGLELTNEQAGNLLAYLNQVIKDTLGLAFQRIKDERQEKTRGI